jgi:hypothetical protein
MDIISIITNIPIWIWFGIGFILFWIQIPITKKIRENPNWEQADKSRKYSLEFLSFAMVIAGLVLALYSIEEFYKAGGSNITPDMYNTLAVNLNIWLYLFEAVLCLAIGVALGGIVLFVYRLMCKPKKDLTILLVDKQKHHDTLKYIKEQEQAKKELEKFFKDLTSKDDYGLKE